MRLFIAIPFSTDAVCALCETQSTLREGGVAGNFVPRQNLHMTLAFLGETLSAKPVLSALKRVPLPETEISFAGLDRIRDILTAELSIDSALAEYVRDLRGSLHDAGIAFDRKPFRPHVTLVRRAELPGGRIKKEWSLPLSGVVSKVDKVCLMRTDFVDRRAHYTVLGGFLPALSDSEKNR